MNLVKSILAGLVAAALGAVLLTVGASIFFSVAFYDITVAFDPISVVRNSPVVWALEALFFALGFHWEFRRARVRQSK